MAPDDAGAAAARSDATGAGVAALRAAGAPFRQTIYSPWLGGDLHAHPAAQGTRTLFVSGGETDVCVSATALGAIDLGYRVILPVDAVFGSADETHDAMMAVYRSRFAVQLATCAVRDLLAHWPEG